MNYDEAGSPLLLWMRENGSNSLEKDPVNLAHRMIFLRLGSIHITASKAAHAVHRLDCSSRAHPTFTRGTRASSLHRKGLGEICFDEIVEA